jgi:hypothetical protein
VLKEMDAKGPFVSLVMGVVVLKDVVVIVAFALTMELVPMVRGCCWDLKLLSLLIVAVQYSTVPVPVTWFRVVSWRAVLLVVIGRMPVCLKACRPAVYMPTRTGRRQGL